MRNLTIWARAGVLVPALLIPMSGQNGAADITIDAASRAAVIDGLLKELNDFYIYPDIAAKMAQDIRERLQKKEYDAITSARQFAGALTKDLRSISRDLHLRVLYSDTVVRSFPFPPPPPPAQLVAQQRATYSQTNFGFAKVERLAGNVGYLDLRSFMPPDWIGEILTSTMNFLGNSRALVIDLRRNGGGGPDSVALICSYFFDQPVRLNDIYTRRRMKHASPGRRHLFRGRAF